MDSKECKKCGEVKSLTDFKKNKLGSYGFAATCRECKGDYRESRQCKKCGEVKPLIDFNRDKTGKYGREARCRKCKAEYNEANRDIANAKARAKYAEKRRLAIERGDIVVLSDEEKKARRKAVRARYYQENREAILAKKKVYRATSPVHRDYMKKWAQENRVKISKHKRKYRQENAERISKREAQYRANNRGEISKRKVKHRCELVDRTPGWACDDTLKLYYDTRKALSDATGIIYHVDHIYPLRGKNVSGLHVPDNLQIIPKTRNLSKNAKQIIDY
jgi:hypothetical protein